VDRTLRQRFLVRQSGLVVPARQRFEDSISSQKYAATSLGRWLTSNKRARTAEYYLLLCWVVTTGAQAGVPSSHLSSVIGR
jgi:hypothetical protein